MNAIRKLITRLILFSLLLIGFTGVSRLNSIDPPTVSAFTVPVNCDINGSCAGVYTLPFGTCQWSTYQTAKTFTVAMEIGMNRNANPGEIEACEIPFALGGGIIKSIDGNSDYTPWTANLSSMFLNIRSCATPACNYPQDQEQLAAHKYTVKGAPQGMPIHGAWANGITATDINFVWNDDIAIAKPTTIHVAFSGTFQ